MTKPSRPGEFELIEKYFAPLAADNPGALRLTDDGGLVTPSPGSVQVVTTDTLVCGVHFRDSDAADLVARKLLRVNLSDLAAMGARPVCYLVALSLSPSIGADWLEAFVGGLAADQAAFGVTLLGGDTTATPGPLTMTLTAIGEVPDGAELRRSGARDGDAVYVSGTIGDAALGLAALRGGPPTPSVAHEALVDRYMLPRPRLALGQALRGIATAACDVSDGLVADLGHIAAASGLAAAVESARVPLSPAARAVVAASPDALPTVLSGGDDYELVFTADPASAEDVAAASAASGTPVTEIGRMAVGDGVTVTDATGRPIALGTTGYRHF